MKSYLAIAAVLVLTACAKAPEAPKPQQYMADTFKGCTWGEVRGKTLSIWSYACGPDSSHIHLVADDTLPGFGLVGDGGEPGVQTYTPVIRTYAKEASAPIDAILPEIRKLSPGPHTDTCTLQAAADPLDPDHSKRKLFQLAPTGAAKTAWDKAEQTGDGTPPCGEMGVSFAGDRLFEVMADDPARVVYIDYGSEVQIFDTTTLKALKAN
ncbi:MAG TPA: hypothetical protein VG839_08060 [Asticcacaulis sp.]|nr:hypothetical protein [Asticcacaulis sp.]